MNLENRAQRSMFAIFVPLEVELLFIRSAFLFLIHMTVVDERCKKRLKSKLNPENAGGVASKARCFPTLQFKDYEFFFFPGKG